MVVDLQPRQHRVHDLTNVLGTAVDAVARAVGVDAEPELGRDHDPIAERRHGFADEFLVRERTVGFRGVEEA